MLVFKERRKLEYLEKDLLEQSREPTTNSTHITPGPGIKPGPHWWEANALTTVPTLLSLLLIMTLTMTPSLDSENQPLEISFNAATQLIRPDFCSLSVTRLTGFHCVCADCEMTKYLSAKSALEITSEKNNIQYNKNTPVDVNM